MRVDFCGISVGRRNSYVSLPVFVFHVATLPWVVAMAGRTPTRVNLHGLVQLSFLLLFLLSLLPLQVLAENKDNYAVFGPCTDHQHFYIFEIDIDGKVSTCTSLKRKHHRANLNISRNQNRAGPLFFV